MSTRTITSGWWWIVAAAAAAALWAITASVAAAGTKVPVRTADQPIVKSTDIGPSDAPVRSAVLTQKDREDIKVQPVHWGYGGYYGYAPYYAYYPRPYVNYYPAPYYPPYTTYMRLTTYVPNYYSAAPGPYYSAAPYVSPYGYARPVYRFPRCAFVGGYYW